MYLSEHVHFLDFIIDFLFILSPHVIPKHQGADVIVRDLLTGCGKMAEQGVELLLEVLLNCQLSYTQGHI